MCIVLYVHNLIRVNNNMMMKYNKVSTIIRYRPVIACWDRSELRFHGAHALLFNKSSKYDRISY